MKAVLSSASIFDDFTRKMLVTDIEDDKVLCEWKEAGKIHEQYYNPGDLVVIVKPRGR